MTFEMLKKGFTQPKICNSKYWETEFSGCLLLFSTAVNTLALL